VEWSPAVWIASARTYLSEVRAEFWKVTWPSQKEYVGGTIGVLVIVALITLVLGVMDLGLGQIMQWIVP
jgi:preprotein translocase subunit SecE